MLHGFARSFAIEAISEPGLVAPSAVWGRMRVWCRGHSIGDYAEAHCPLYPAYRGFKELLQALPSLWAHEFDGLSDADLWNFLDGRLYGHHGDVSIDDDRTIGSRRSDWDRYGAFSFLTNWGEQFDRDGKSFIFCRPGGRVRVLNRSLPKLAAEAPLAEVMQAITSFIAWFEEETRRFRGDDA